MSANGTVGGGLRDGGGLAGPKAAGLSGRIRRTCRRMANAAGLLWLSARLTLGWQAVVLALVAAGVFVVAALGGRAWSVRGCFYTLTLIETAFFVILSMALLPREKEERTLEVMLVSVRSAHRLVLVKFLPVCLFVLVAAVCLTVGFYWLRGGFPVLRMLLVSYGLAATVGMLTLLLTTYLRNQYAAATVASVVAIVISAAWIDPFLSFHGDLFTSTRRGAEPDEVRTYVDRRGGGGFMGDGRGRGGPPRGRSRGRPGSRIESRRRGEPNLTMNRILLAVLFGFLYDYTVRRTRQLDLWMR